MIFAQEKNNGNYTLVVEGFDWGPANSKVILANTQELNYVYHNQFSVVVTRSSECDTNIKPSNGERQVVYAYFSDANGNHSDSKDFITLNLGVSPHTLIDAPMQYFGKGKCARRNRWVNYQLQITHKDSKQIWDTESRRIMPIVDEFDLSGKFVHNDIQLRYASYRPKAAKGKLP